jgi:hypothetical protein
VEDSGGEKFSSTAIKHLIINRILSIIKSGREMNKSIFQISIGLRK